MLIVADLSEKDRKELGQAMLNDLLLMEYNKGREDALKECIGILEMNLDTGSGSVDTSSEVQYKNRTLIELLKAKLPKQ